MKKIFLLFCLMFVVTGCVSLGSQQKLELASMQKGEPPVYVEEKDPTVGIILGFLPGGGSFYTRQYGMGVLDLLLWPVSILWDPISGYQGSEFINYEESKFKAKRQQKKELSILDERKINKEVTEEVYFIERRKIEAKYTFD